MDIQRLCLSNTNRHMTFMSKQCTCHQCSNNTNRWMTFVFIPYEFMKKQILHDYCCQIVAHEVCDVDVLPLVNE
jgi:hypothetical protein